MIHAIWIFADCWKRNRRFEETLIPGGSIAHELHSYGIPWVIACQLQRTKSRPPSPRFGIRNSEHTSAAFPGDRADENAL